jgi:hypothetical protein
MTIRFVVRFEEAEDMGEFIELALKRGHSYSLERGGQVIGGGSCSTVIGHGGNGSSAGGFSSTLGEYYGPGGGSACYSSAQGMGGCGGSASTGRPDLGDMIRRSTVKDGIINIPLPEGAVGNPNDDTFTMPDGLVYRASFMAGGSRSPVDVGSNLGGSSEQKRDGTLGAEGASSHTPTPIGLNGDEDEV